jgi:hypothetical protein
MQDLSLRLNLVEPKTALVFKLRKIIKYLTIRGGR